MSTLPDSIAAFSADLRNFAAHTTEGISSLRRTVNCKPCIGPTVFRESCKELVQQAAEISSEVEKLESAALDAVSLEELLSHCLALHKDSQRKIVELEDRLRQYGYRAAYRGPVVEDPQGPLDSQPGTADAHANVACCLTEEKAGKDEKEQHEERYSTVSPEPLGDLTGKYAPASTSTVRQLTVTPTPSPVASSLISAVSISPSLRELQRKYAASSGESKGVRSGSVTQRDMEQKYGACDAATPDAIGRKLAYLALETPGGALRGSSSQLEEIAKKVDHLALEHPRFSPTNRLAAPAGVTASTVSGQCPHAAHAAAGSVLSKSAAKKESVTARLSAGEAPWDMLSLKAAIHAALPGTGEVARMVSSATFQPQAAAFTSLLHMCAKAKLWQKALEVFQAMRDYHPAVRPNTVHFSSLISACATAGRWEEAMQVFSHMKAAAKNDSACAPNVITYSALMTACCAGGRPDKAYELFRSMPTQDIRPDHICYSTLIAGFERHGDVEMAAQLSSEMQAAGMQPSLLAPPGPPAAKPTPFIDQFGRKIKQGGALGSPRHSAGLQLSPTRASAANRTPHPSLGHPIWTNPFCASPKTGGHGHMGLQTPGGLGLYDGGSLQQQGGDRSGFIPASYGALYSNLNANPRGGYGVPVEENTLELRKAVLHTRSPSTAFHYGGAQDLPCLDTQTPFLPPAATLNHAMASGTPHHLINPNRTPSTAELLRAAHSGSTAQLGRLYALQQQASQAAQEPRRSVTFGPGVGSQPAGGSPTKASEGFSLFQSSHLPASSRAQAPTPAVPSPFAQQQHQAQQSSAAYSSSTDAFAAAGERLQRFDAAPGSPVASSRRGAAPHSRTNSRSFDAAPGSPLAPRAPPEPEPEASQQVAWNAAAVSHLYAASLSHQGSVQLQAQLSGASLQSQPSGGFGAQDAAYGLPPCGLNRQPSSSMQGQVSGNFSAYLGASSLQSQHSMVAGSNLSRQQSAVSVGPFSQALGDFAAAAGGFIDAGSYGGHASNGAAAAASANPWADNVFSRAAAAQPAGGHVAHAGSLQGSMQSAACTNAAADASNSVSVEEYAGLPLRLSRQLQLGAINEGLAFITRGVQGQLARGFPLDAAGMRVDELDALGLGHAQKTALLQSLLQLKRLRLIMRDTHRTYTLA